MSSFSNDLVISPETDWVHLMQHQLEMLGCIVRPHGNNQLEIWEAHLHEHYLVKLEWKPTPKLDIVQLS